MSSIEQGQFNAIQVPSIGRMCASLGEAIEGVLPNVAKAYRRRCAIRHFDELDNRMLRDIGADRSGGRSAQR